MRSLTAWLLNSLGLLLIVAPIPSQAATIRQNFELTVTGVIPPSTANPSNPDLSNLPLPAVGTKRPGAFVYDESQLTLNQESIYQEYYYLVRRGSLPSRIFLLTSSITLTLRSLLARLEVRHSSSSPAIQRGSTRQTVHISTL